MSFEDTASNIGTSSSAIEQLLNGHASEGIAVPLGTSSSAIQKFLNGQASDSIADVININTAELQHLRNKMDNAGAKGFILGLAMALPK